MSDTVRSYTRVTPRSYRNRRRSNRSGWFILVLFVAMAVGFLVWLARDSHPVYEFFPRGKRLGAVINNPIESRERLASAPLWEALPEDSRWVGIPDLLRENFGVPEWLLNNLVRERLYVAADDTEAFSDVLGLSRMTRLGTLCERAFRLMQWVDFEPSGGLGLRRLPDDGVYYAVRGRVLIASPSRETLIEALTLPEGASISEGDLAALSQSGTEDVQGIYVLDDNSILGRNFAYIGFAVRAVSEETRVDLRATPRDDAPSAVRALIAGAEPVELTEPPPGLAGVSLDFGKPASTVWEALLAAADQSDWPDRLNAAMDEADVRNWTGVRDLLVELTGARGPGIRVTLAGVETDEFVPMPELAFTFDGNHEDIARSLADASGPPPAAGVWTMWPRYDAAIQRLYIPMAGGPALEPTAGSYGSGLLVATSRRVGDDLLGRRFETRPARAPGNLYARLNPQAFVEQCVSAGRMLASEGMLRGYTPESFERSAARWQNAAATVESMWGIARAEVGTLTAEIHVVSRGSS